MRNQVTSFIATAAETLQEPAVDLLTRTVKVIGTERANAILAQTLEIQANGGMPRLDGQGMRTLGGIYFYLVKEQCSRQERFRIFGAGPAGTAQGPGPRCTWDDVQAALGELANTGEEATMKLTLIGRPTAVQTKGSTKIFQLTGKAPTSLPKELPPLPKSPPLTWTVIVGLRQWNRVKDSLEQFPDDRLVIDGWPCIQEGQPILMATSCQSIKMTQAKKAEQQEAQKSAAATENA